MGSNGAVADVEPVGDLLIAEAAPEQFEDLLLSGSGVPLARFTATIVCSPSAASRSIADSPPRRWCHAAPQRKTSRSMTVGASRGVQLHLMWPLHHRSWRLAQMVRRESHKDDSVTLVCRTTLQHRSFFRIDPPPLLP